MWNKDVEQGVSFSSPLKRESTLNQMGVVSGGLSARDIGFFYMFETHGESWLRDLELFSSSVRP